MENAKPIDISAIPYTGIDTVPPVYSNNADTTIAPWDIRILFSEVIGMGGGFQKIMRANVVMTPAHAKALVVALNTTVQQYEQLFGEIKLPSQAAEGAKA